MLDVISFITAAGYAGIFAIIFAESGLFFAFFLPGDSLLFTAGLLASQGVLNFPLLAGIIFAAAALGNSVGYAFGRKIGPMIFTREDSIFFHKDNIKRAETFYAKYGKKAIILARFLPVFRTFIPILAGVGSMPYKTFLAYNLIGSALWTLLVAGIGYTLGTSIPNIDAYLIPIILCIIVVSLMPAAWEFYKSRKK